MFPDTSTKIRFKGREITLFFKSILHRANAETLKTLTVLEPKWPWNVYCRHTQKGNMHIISFLNFCYFKLFQYICYMNLFCISFYFSLGDVNFSILCFSIFWRQIICGCLQRECIYTHWYLLQHFTTFLHERLKYSLSLDGVSCEEVKSEY